jgi:hypothetical protein
MCDMGKFLKALNFVVSNRREIGALIGTGLIVFGYTQEGRLLLEAGH